MTWVAALEIARRLLLPAILSGIIIWLLANGFDIWVPVICSVAEAADVFVTQCNETGAL
jgi:hypothetical protein